MPAAGPPLSVIPNFPFVSFGDMLKAIADGRCYLSVDQSSAFQFTSLTSTRSARAFDGLLSWVPFLCTLASVVGAIVSKNGWFLIGILSRGARPFDGSYSSEHIAPVLFAAKQDSSVSPTLRADSEDASHAFYADRGCLLELDCIWLDVVHGSLDCRVDCRELHPLRSPDPFFSSPCGNCPSISSNEI